MIAEVAPAVPEAVIASAGAALILTWIALWCAKYGYAYTLGALLRKLASILDFSILGVSVKLGGELEKFDHWVQEQIGNGIAATEAAMHRVWNGQVWLVHEIGNSLAWFAAETENGFHVMVHGVTPTIVNNVVAPVSHGLGRLHRELVAVEQGLVAQLNARAHALEVELEHDFGLAWRGIDAVDKKTAARIGKWAAVIGASVAGLADYVYHPVTTRLRGLEELLAGGFIAAVALEIVTRNFGWLRCSNVNRVGRALCRFDTGLLDLLLGGAIEAAVVADLCDFIFGVSVAARKARPLLLEFVAVEDALIGCHGMTAAPLLAVPSVSIPPQSQRVKLAA